MTELGEFLRSRRDRVAPSAVGLSSHGRRRVPGLRREELAQLAGVSVTYLTRLEQGQSHNASEAVVAALARALQLDSDERLHLMTLARPSTAARRRGRRPEAPHAGASGLLQAMGVPAVLLGRFNDILDWNTAGHLLLAGHIDAGAPARAADRPNHMRMLFLDPHTRDLYHEWEREAALAVASLRFVASQFADDPQLAALVGELSLSSPVFAKLWARHSVRLCSSGSKQFSHPTVGALTLNYEVLHLPDTDGQRILAYAAVPGSASAAALRLLESR
ncbi:helix-turn-helix transcriptional regulator [Microbacterium sp. 3J1]|uniref:helix-turn-helix transcriptional regulator n=1 Tax=Microbacterium sp. 3J1 TaxID=861269 RepID=UPI000AE7AC20|nr:helix-turn-helix transcriptional regulator [Microbacterium sp. 3J1]